ncbi:hypothetical protein NDK50_29095 [Paraburkholderia bryophila]|uniref:hypothetical protein n=1 Tax=Paraburkholderia bryophila TaxID=420952 RepID=UPI002349AD92|nr:hypothetical protein [Paraburkholderia bryophila]WCM22088.1 hypothetical protein NDK50_29095 [Paraburkholderia bryophila]
MPAVLIAAGMLCGTARDPCRSRVFSKRARGAIMTSFVDLQQQFAKTEFAAIGIDPSRGQVFQPAATLTGDDSVLWSYFDTIPGAPPIFSPAGGGSGGSGETFFQAYSALINSLIAGTNPLDPIKAAKQRLATWGDKPPAWSVGVAGLTRQLHSASTISFDFSSDAVADPAFWGLWGNSQPASGPSVSFASGNVSGQFKFKNALLFAPAPSDWYVSSALSLAHATKTGRPWDPDSPINWQTTFGPNGNMQSFVGGLYVVSGLNIQFTSSAAFSKADQRAISEAGSQGMWPYYLGLSSNAVTKVQFVPQGQMTVSVVSVANVPVVIAASVLSAAQYLGG